MMLSTFESAVRSAFPELEIQSVQWNTNGQNSDILIINQEIIFRFPRYAQGVAQLRREAELLQAIRPYISLSIPEPKYLKLDSDSVGESFLGYPMLNGEPLWRQTLAAVVDQERVDNIARQLATFLCQLHQLPVDQLSITDMLVDDTQQRWSEMFERMRRKLFPHMRPDARIQVQRHFSAYLENPVNFSYEPLLRHGDFGGSNILFDPAAEEISGIIDFGSTTLGDPACDLAGLLWYGESFVHKMAETYPMSDQFWERIRFCHGTFALQEALFGVENDDEDAFRAGIASYE